MIGAQYPPYHSNFVGASCHPTDYRKTLNTKHEILNKHELRRFEIQNEIAASACGLLAMTQRLHLGLCCSFCEIQASEFGVVFSSRLVISVGGFGFV